MATQTKTPLNDVVSPENNEPSKWCDLPKDLLIRIAHKLVFTLKIDLPRMRSVCSRWRSYLPLDEVRNLDFPVPVPSFDPTTPLILPETRFQLLSPLSPEPGSLGGKWLARMAPLWSNKWHLFNPLNIHEYFFAAPPVVGSINILDCHVLELSRTFSLLDANETKAKPISKKVVGGWNLDSDYDFGVLALFERERGGGLWLWRLRDDDWIKIEGTSLNDDNTSVHRILDIVYHDGKFYAFELSSWRIGVIDPNSDYVTMEFIAAPNIFNDPIDLSDTLTVNGQLYYLAGVYFVSSDSQLYLVLDVYPKTEITDGNESEAKSTILVFVMKEQGEGEEEGKINSNWEQVKSVGDQIFFIGYDISFALPSASVNLPQWKPSSICLFTRPFPLIFGDICTSKEVPKGLERLKMLTYAKYWRYYRFFEMGEEENSVVSFEKLSMDVYTRLFFPPPAWVKWRCTDLDNVEFSLENVEFKIDESW